MAKKLQVYETPEVTVSFDPNVCKHSGVCLRTLPAVFDVRRARWIHAEAAEANDVVEAIQKCPSGALQSYRNVSRNPAAASQLARRILLNHLAVCMTVESSRQEAAEAMCSTIADARAYDFVGLYDLHAGEVTVVGWSGATPPTHPSFSAEFGLCGAAARGRETLVVNDVAADSRYITTSASTRAEMIVPILDPSTREVIGTIDVASDRVNAFGREDRELVEDCAHAIHTFWTERT
jgi:putative methionine-R-sulfoxide reductase with GAF domain